MPKTVCLDFDGVLSAYAGWVGEDHLDPPRPGVEAFLAALKALGYELVIHTTRDPWRVFAWLEAHHLAGYFDDRVGNIRRDKPPAVCYLDDRAVCFRGDYEEALRLIADFRAYWEEPTHG